MPDVNYISKIQLPSGNVYWIKDQEARDLIAKGLQYVIAYKAGTAPVVSQIPSGATVEYQGQTYTGTLAPTSGTVGKVYLVAYKQNNNDYYSEYVTVEENGSYFWEKLGDTEIDLEDLVLSKSATTVVGTGATITASTSNVTFTGGETDTFLKGVQVTTQPTASITTKTGGQTLVTGVSNFTATGGSVTADSTENKDAYTTLPTYTVSNTTVTASTNTKVDVVTGIGESATGNYLTGVEASKSRLVTTSITGITGSTTASKATEGTAINVATTGTAVSVVNGIDTTGTAGNEIITSVANGSVRGVQSTTTTATKVTTGTPITVAGAGSDATVVNGIDTTGTAGNEIITSVANGSILGVQTATTTASKATAGAAIAVATTGTAVSVVTGLTATASTGDIVTNVTMADITVPKAASAASTVATGNASGESGTGANSWIHTCTYGENETLIIGAATMDTTDVTGVDGTTAITPSATLTKASLNSTNVTPAVANDYITPYTFADVTVPIKAAAETTVLTGATEKYLATTTVKQAGADQTVATYTLADVTVPIMATGDTSVVTGATTKYVTMTSVTPAVGNVTITPYTFADVTVPVAGNAVTVATGSIDANGSGAEISTDVTSTSATAVSSLGSLEKASVLGSATTFALSSNEITGTGGGTTAVLGASTTFNVTDPTVSATVTSDSYGIDVTNVAVGADGTGSAVTSVGTATAAAPTVGFNNTDSKSVISDVEINQN